MQRIRVRLSSRGPICGGVGKRGSRYTRSGGPLVRVMWSFTSCWLVMAGLLGALGKQLYEVKYECQSCHTIGSTGGYVGPNLNNAGNWLAPAWIEAWLRNPQALVPDTIEPRRAFTENEIQALTAYLLTLRVSGKSQGSAQVAAVRQGSAPAEALP